MAISRAKLIAEARRVIQPGQYYDCTLPDQPQVMTVRSVTKTHVHFTRKGERTGAMHMMEILRFCEIAIAKGGR